ncbi:PadR family transcriptional regulator [Roseibium limicola]|uniref:PadR family transcriptional regulator n=1 Tax=Roseibium limicola TaxID=2816037 RepID=A0A939ERC3_9HYPH|nr:PadR family transcriptional regulator [Roseibium limicola]MBO0346128.1 PadR family transcriptional regulator [Roseibium limicola]
MSVRKLCLTILSFGDATGYEIRKESTSGRFSYFDEASFGSIYPTLAKLENEGLVTVREESQSGKPTRKVYSITKAGRAALVTELCAPQQPDSYRSPFLLIALCAEHLDQATLRAAIERRRLHLQEELSVLQGHNEETQHPGARWTRNYGIACMEFSLGYLASHGEELIAMAGRPAGANPIDDGSGRLSKTTEQTPPVATEAAE